MRMQTTQLLTFATLLSFCNGATESPDGKSKRSQDTPDQILKKLLDEGHYEKRLRPLSAIKPLMVECTLYVVSLGPVSEVDMTFKLGIYFRQYWTDPRLAFNSSLQKIVLSQDLLEDLWLPDSFFQTETESYIHEVTKPNVFFRLHEDGKILMSIRVTVTSRCPMDLRHFPMDTQECELRIASWGFTEGDLQYEWLSKKDSQNKIIPPIKLAEDITLSNFRVVNYQWNSYIRNLTTGRWDTLAVTFRFGRNTLYFIIQMYIPSTLIVMVSWVSFWVGRASVPARAALGITTVLTLLTLISSTNANMPKISYMKAIDVYFAGCFLFVFASLIEFAAVCYLDRSRITQTAVPSRGSSGGQGSAVTVGNTSASMREGGSTRSRATVVSTDLTNKPPINTMESALNSSLVSHSNRFSHLMSNEFTGSKTSLQQAVELSQQRQEEMLKRSNSTKSVSRVDNITLQQYNYHLGHIHNNNNSFRRRQQRKLSYSMRRPSIRIKNDQGQINVGSIDRFSRYFFPLTFTVLMCLYWVIYYSISSNLKPVGENGVVLPD
ncbi:glycine receptor subunit alpha-2-like [Convolutriloba macropyga]|uniref:glycine receptor subunit alpha-2-like n=1 Tax=Convolutriloba macropyga TaxID=536237 RepID=UPI003F52390A